MAKKKRHLNKAWRKAVSLGVRRYFRERKKEAKQLKKSFLEELFTRSDDFVQQITGTKGPAQAGPPQPSEPGKSNWVLIKQFEFPGATHTSLEWQYPSAKNDIRQKLAGKAGVLVGANLEAADQLERLAELLRKQGLGKFSEAAEAIGKNLQKSVRPVLREVDLAPEYAFKAKINVRDQGGVDQGTYEVEFTNDPNYIAASIWRICRNGQQGLPRYAANSEWFYYITEIWVLLPA